MDSIYIILRIIKKTAILFWDQVSLSSYQLFISISYFGKSGLKNIFYLLFKVFILNQIIKIISHAGNLTGGPCPLGKNQISWPLVHMGYVTLPKFTGLDMALHRRYKAMSMSIVQSSWMSSVHAYCTYWIDTFHTCQIYTSIAHGIKNPLRRTSEHTSLYNFKFLLNT